MLHLSDPRHFRKEDGGRCGGGRIGQIDQALGAVAADTTVLTAAAATAAVVACRAAIAAGGNADVTTAAAAAARAILGDPIVNIGPSGAAATRGRAGARLGAATTSAVKRASSSEGSGSPLGWLCTRTMAAARSAIASRNTSRGCTSDEFRIPLVIVMSRSRAPSTRP